MYVYDEKNDRWIPLRKTREYQQRKRRLRDIWIGLGLVMLTLPTPVTLLLGLFAGFVSLAYLDEYRYSSYTPMDK